MPADGEIVINLDSSDEEKAPPDEETKARLAREAEERKKRREMKKQQREQEEVPVDSVDLTSDSPPAPSVVPPRPPPVYAQPKAEAGGGGGGGGSSGVAMSLQQRMEQIKAAMRAAHPPQAPAPQASAAYSPSQPNAAAAPPQPKPDPHRLVPPYRPAVPVHNPFVSKKKHKKHKHHGYGGYNDPYGGGGYSYGGGGGGGYPYGGGGYPYGGGGHALGGVVNSGAAAKAAREQQAQQKQDEADDMDVGLSEKDAQTKTFCEYTSGEMLSTQYGFKPHPDSINETASMSAVPPPTTKHKLILPQRIIEEGRLTQVQLESVLQASAQHELRLSDGTRNGYFLGDGPGVGKGRQIGGMIAENFFRKDEGKNRDKAVWISVSADLIWDSKRDLRDLGLLKLIRCHELKKYSLNQDLGDHAELDSGVMFLTYSLLVSAKAQVRRIDQLVKWCGGEDFHGVLALDEVHRAKHMKQTQDENGQARFAKQGTTKSAQFVHDLQQMLPNARVVYVSATGATEPDHMQCFTRLGLWGPRTSFKQSFDFVDSIKKGECGAMELVAMHMKATGQYLCRVLSFEGATFEILKENLSDKFVDMYDKAADFWMKLIMEHADASIDAKKAGLKIKVSKSVLWGAHQRFWMQMCIAAKVPHVIEICKKAEDEGKCVVIGLQSTGESVSEFVEQQGINDDDVPSTASGILVWFVQKHCNDFAAYQAILSEANDLVLPGNPLDEIIDELGGVSKVAEMTGRKNRMVKEDGKWKLKPRVRETTDTINIEERKMFQNGDKIFAIISEAASSGISLQADRRVKNQRRRVHITLQLPWSADKAVQQMGRSHRSNQSTAPEFKLLLTPLGGESRFASAVANRLQSLGALTQGDRRAAGYSQDLIEFAIDSKHGLHALKQLLQVVFMDGELPERDLADFRASVGDVNAFLQEAGDALKTLNFTRTDATKAGQKSLLRTFLNRILGVPVKLQNQIFALFQDLLQAHIRVAKLNNTYDEGIVDIAASAVNLVSEEVIYRDSKSEAPTILTHIQGDRGVSFEQAVKLLQSQMDKNDPTNEAGFYCNNRDINSFMLVLRKETVGQGKNRYIRVMPGTGHHYNDEHITDIRKIWSKSTADKAKDAWKRTYDYAEKNCGHAASNLSCPGARCTFKKRMKSYWIVTGLVLPFWDVMKNVWRSEKDSSLSFDQIKVKVVRVQCADKSDGTKGKRIVGILVPENMVRGIKEKIEKGVPNADHAMNLTERIVRDPFFKVTRTFETRTCVNPRGEDKFEFSLIPGWEKSDGRDMSIRMRAFKTPFSNAAVAESDLVDCGWISCVVVVNGNRVVERNIQEPKALVIDKYCKAGLNTVCVHSSGERFVVSVQMGSATPIEEVEKMVQANTLDESQQLLKRIIAPGDDDIACDEIEVSLRCPFGFVRIKTPARGRDCDHIQCFDLQTWLQYCSTYGSSKCFNCNKIIPIGLLRTCPLMADVLRQVSGEADKVTITKDGNFRGLTLRKADPPAADASQGQSDGGGPSRNDKQVQDKDMAEEDSADDAHLSEFAKKLRMSGVWEYNREVNEAYERGFSKQHEQQQREEQSKSAKASPAKDEEEVAEDLDDFIDDDEDEEASSMDKDDDEDAGNETDGSQISTEKKKKVALVRHSRRASAGKKISYAESDDSEEAMDEDSDEAGPSSGRPKAPTSAGAGASSSASGKRKRVTRAASSDDGGSTTDGGNDSDMSSASERKKAAQKGAKGKRKARAASIGEDEGDSWEPGADSD